MVVDGEDDAAMRRAAVAPRAARLLIKGLDGLGKAGVNGISHVRLVDTHAKRLRTYHQGDLIAPEGLGVLPFSFIPVAGPHALGRSAAIAWRPRLEVWLQQLGGLLDTKIPIDVW